MSWPTVRRMKEQRCLHIEAEGCIINIHQDLHDRFGRQVTSVSIIPDKYAGEPRRKVIGSTNTRIITLKQKNK